MIPAAFTGGWVRAGIGLNGAAEVEDATVWWLQGPARHADLRVPLDAGSPTCFSGITSWDGSALTWTREVDLENFDGEDVGTTSWDGADLLESGTFSGPAGRTTYVERWVKLPDSTTPLFALRRGGVRCVRAGRYAITLADERPAAAAFAATGWVLVEGRWKMHHTLPGLSLAPPPPEGDGAEDGWAAEPDI